MNQTRWSSLPVLAILVFAAVLHIVRTASVPSGSPLDDVQREMIAEECAVVYLGDGRGLCDRDTVNMMDPLEVTPDTFLPLPERKDDTVLPPLPATGDKIWAGISDSGKPVP